MLPRTVSEFQKQIIKIGELYGVDVKIEPLGLDEFGNRLVKIILTQGSDDIIVFNISKEILKEGVLEIWEEEYTDLEALFDNLFEKKPREKPAPELKPIKKPEEPIKEIEPIPSPEKEKETEIEIEVRETDIKTVKPRTEISPTKESKDKPPITEVHRETPDKTELLKASDITDIIMDFEILVTRFAYFLRAHEKYADLKKFRLYFNRKYYYEIEIYEITESGMEAKTILWEEMEKRSRKPRNLTDLLNADLSSRIGYFHIIFAEWVTFLYRYTELVFQITIDKTTMDKFGAKLNDGIRDFFKALNTDFPFMFLPMDYEPTRYLPQIPTPEGFEVHLPPADPPKIAPPPFKDLPIEASF